MIIIHEKSMAQFANLLAEELQIAAAQVEISKFSNGEFKIEDLKIDSNQAFVVFPKIDNINERLMELFLILGACQTCEIIDVFIPYIPYSRQNDSSSFKLIIDILKSLKVRKILTIDIHKTTSDKNIINILPHELFGDNFQGQKFIIVAPDAGAILRAKAFADYLQTDLILIDKQTGKTENLNIAAGRKCLIIDDIIDSGKTSENAKKILNAAGAIEIQCCVSDFARTNLAEFYKYISKKILDEII